MPTRASASTGDIHLNLLEQVVVASPCSARWEDMRGDDKVRHCAQCNLNVHNFSAMTRDEANALLADRMNGTTGRLCGRFYRRADGTVITQDCPTGLRAARMRAAKMAGRIAAALGVVVGASVGSSKAASPRWESWGWALRLTDLGPVKWAFSRLHPGQSSMGMPIAIMGDFCIPSPPAPPPPPGAGGSAYGPSEPRDLDRQVN